MSLYLQSILNDILVGRLNPTPHQEYKRRAQAKLRAKNRRAARKFKTQHAYVPLCLVPKPTQRELWRPA